MEVDDQLYQCVYRHAIWRLFLFDSLGYLGVCKILSPKLTKSTGTVTNQTFFYTQLNLFPNCTISIVTSLLCWIDSDWKILNIVVEGDVNVQMFVTMFMFTMFVWVKNLNTSNNPNANKNCDILWNVHILIRVKWWCW